MARRLILAVFPRSGAAGLSRAAPDRGSAGSANSQNQPPGRPALTSTTWLAGAALATNSIQLALNPPSPLKFARLQFGSPNAFLKSSGENGLSSGRSPSGSRAQWMMV